MILQGQLGIRIKAEKGANADGLIAQVGEFGISVAIVIVARAIAVQMCIRDSLQTVTYHLSNDPDRMNKLS